MQGRGRGRPKENAANDASGKLFLLFSPIYLIMYMTHWVLSSRHTESGVCLVSRESGVCFESEELNGRKWGFHF